jgi:hypothetical protein
MEELKPIPETGQCRRCRRTLTNPTSILFQLGSVCREKEGVIVHKDKLTKKVKFTREVIIIPEFDLDSWLTDEDDKDVRD